MRNLGLLSTGAAVRHDGALGKQIRVRYARGRRTFGHATSMRRLVLSSRLGGPGARGREHHLRAALPLGGVGRAGHRCAEIGGTDAAVRDPSRASPTAAVRAGRREALAEEPVGRAREAAREATREPRRLIRALRVETNVQAVVQAMKSRLIRMDETSRPRRP